MYCPGCNCEFVGWGGKCPNCKTALAAEPPPEAPAGEPLPYEALVEMTRESGGRLEVKLDAVEVGMQRKWGFPYLGYGYGWAQKLRGSLAGSLVKFTASEVGRSRSWGFPYFSFGFAWEKEMQGAIGGNQAALVAVKVRREKKWRFPYLGYGRAWTEAMSGECGDQLALELATTEVGRRSGWSFPYLGYGFGWVKEAVLVITLA